MILKLHGCYRCASCCVKFISLEYAVTTLFRLCFCPLCYRVANKEVSTTAFLGLDIELLFLFRFDFKPEEGLIGSLALLAPLMYADKFAPDLRSKLPDFPPTIEVFGRF